MNKKFVLFGRGYLVRNFINYDNRKFILCEDITELMKVKFNSKYKYIFFYLFIRKSKTVEYNKKTLIDVMNYLSRINHKFIYFSTTEFHKNNNYSKIHAECEKIINKKKQLIIRLSQIYGGLFQLSNHYGINYFLNKIKNKNFIVLNQDYKNVRRYLLVNNLIKILKKEKILNRSGKIYVAGKKEISFIDIVKILVKQKNRKFFILIKKQKKLVNKPKKIIYEKKINKIFVKENLKNNLIKLISK